MANDEAQPVAAGSDQLLTLTEVKKRTGISMPTLQKYKRQYPARIPSTGKGRAQRYPESALPVFAQLRDENMARRGRPRKAAAAGTASKRRPTASKRPAAKRGAAAKAAKGKGATAAKRPAKAATKARGAAKAKGAAKAQGAAKTKGAGKAKTASGVLTLLQVAQRTGISYPTLLRYVKNSLDKLPHVGSGRGRRFRPESLDVFRTLRRESRSGRPPGSGKKQGGRQAAAKGATGARRGRPPGSGIGAAVKGLLRRLEQRLAGVEKQLRRPFRVEVKR